MLVTPIAKIDQFPSLAPAQIAEIVSETGARIIDTSAQKNPILSARNPNEAIEPQSPPMAKIKNPASDKKFIVRPNQNTDHGIFKSYYY
ncbi:hypothetical protein MCEMIH15_01990 [Caulobacteraceae bacterium]